MHSGTTAANTPNSGCGRIRREKRCAHEIKPVETGSRAANRSQALGTHTALRAPYNQWAIPEERQFSESLAVRTAGCSVQRRRHRYLNLPSEVSRSNLPMWTGLIPVLSLRFGWRRMRLAVHRLFEGSNPSPVRYGTGVRPGWRGLRNACQLSCRRMRLQARLPGGSTSVWTTVERSSSSLADSCRARVSTRLG